MVLLSFSRSSMQGGGIFLGAVGLVVNGLAEMDMKVWIVFCVGLMYVGFGSA